MGFLRAPGLLVVGTLLGMSEVAKALEDDVREAARSDAKVLITGESGVGKELVGQQIHSLSARSRAPVVTINCAGLPDSLLESELFGHARGSFTDAYRDQPGWLEQAHGGTIFMDEVGEMSLRMQALLLRFLESGEIQRIGSDRRSTHVDVRIVTATNRNLPERIASGDFREDLYYRMNVIHIAVPPLRERRQDIPAFIGHFLPHYAEMYKKPKVVFTPEAHRALQGYDWPGNVRELKNVIERLVVRSRKDWIAIEELPSEILLPGRSASSSDAATDNTRIADILTRMSQERVDFWSAVHEPFMSHDLTREQLRDIVRTGLTQTKGSYRLLVQRFNMRETDYRRFLSFLRKHDCHLPFHGYRVGSESADATARRA